MNILRIEKEERLPALLMAIIAGALNTLFICYLQPFLATTTNRATLWKQMLEHLNISGYDPMTIIMVSRWNIDYNPYRHPLYAYFCWPLNQLNEWLRTVTGTDCALYILSFILVTFSVYGMLFFRRILRHHIGLPKVDANILTLLFYSMAYVMLMLFTPDHFAFSMPMLLLLTYLTAQHLDSGKGFSIILTIFLFLFTAGISLNNGVKVFLASLAVRGKKFFKPIYLALAIALPSAAIWYFAEYEYSHYVLPRELAQHRFKEKRKQQELKKQQEKQRKDSIASLSTKATAVVMSPDSIDKRTEKTAKKKPEGTVIKINTSKNGTPIANQGFLKWTDTTTSRWQTAIHNLFGESIQLHRDNLLKDVLRTRKVFEHYRNPLQYLIEALLVGLFIAGIWCGRRSRLLWTAMSFFAFDMGIHLVLGFGINEIFIMSPHFLFVLPLATAFVLRKASSGRLHRSLQICLGCMALYLFVYNGSLIVKYLLH